MGCSKEQLRQLTQTLEQTISAGGDAAAGAHYPRLELSLGNPPRGKLVLTSIEGLYASVYRFCLEQRCSAQEFQDLVERAQGDVEGIADPMRSFRKAGLHAHTDKVFHHGYERTHSPWLAPYRYSSLKLLEIGYLEGASSTMWRQYFPRAERVIFLDLAAPKG